MATDARFEGGAPTGERLERDRGAGQKLVIAQGLLPHHDVVEHGLARGCRSHDDERCREMLFRIGGRRARAMPGDDAAHRYLRSAGRFHEQLVRLRIVANQRGILKQRK